MPKTPHYPARQGTVKVNKKLKKESAETKHENPVLQSAENKALSYLNELKGIMAAHIAKAEKSKSLSVQVNEGKAACSVYNDYMEKLTTYYNQGQVGTIQAVEELKEEVRRMYLIAKDKVEPQERELDARTEKFGKDLKTAIPKELSRRKQIKDEKAHQEELGKLARDLEEFQIKEQEKFGPKIAANKEKKAREEEKAAWGGIEEDIGTREEQVEKTKKITGEMAKEYKARKIVELMDKIDETIAMLLSKTNAIGQNLPEAKGVAEQLCKELYAARTDYEIHLKTGKYENSDPITVKVAGELFKGRCDEAINNAMPVLSRDLGWGEYLKNILRNIANFVTGNIAGSTFFKPVKSDASQAAGEAGKALEEEGNVPSAP